MGPFDLNDEVNLTDLSTATNVIGGSGLFGTANNVGGSVPGFGANNDPPGEKASGSQSQQAAFGSSGGFGSFANQSQQPLTFGASLFGQQIPQPQIQQQQHFEQQQQQHLQQQQQQQHFQQQRQQVQQQPQPSLFGPQQPQSSLFGQPQQLQPQPGPSFGVASSALPDEDDFEDVSSPGTTAGVEPTTVVSETPIAISFSVHGESTIPSDDVVHQVVIALLPFEATISYISVPRIEPRVYLQVRSIFLSIEGVEMN